MSELSHFVAIDLETTGLDPRHDLILEIAAVAITVGLDRVEDQLHMPVHPTELRCEAMLDDYISDTAVLDMHYESGLYDDVESASVPEREARTRLAELTARFPGAYLLGSGVHFDRAFLDAQWPEVLDPLHYRNLDVSTLRTFCQLYQPDAKYEPRKAHRAMADVQDAIAELRHYRDLLICYPVSA